MKYKRAAPRKEAPQKAILPPIIPEKNRGSTKNIAPTAQIEANKQRNKKIKEIFPFFFKYTNIPKISVTNENIKLNINT